jgi:hypothetical protein
MILAKPVEKYGFPIPCYSLLDYRILRNRMASSKRKLDQKELTVMSIDHLG